MVLSDSAQSVDSVGWCFTVRVGAPATFGLRVSCSAQAELASPARLRRAAPAPANAVDVDGGLACGAQENRVPA